MIKFASFLSLAWDQNFSEGEAPSPSDKDPLGTLKVNKHSGSTFSAEKINFANIRGIRHRSELVFTLRHADYHNRPLTGGEESHQYLCIPGRDITDRTRDTEK